MKKSIPLIGLILLIIIAIIPALLSRIHLRAANRRDLSRVTRFIGEGHFDRADSLLQTTNPFVFGLKGRAHDSVDVSRDSTAVGALFRLTLRKIFKYDAAEDSAGITALSRQLTSLPPTIRTIAKIEAAHYLQRKFTGKPRYRALINEKFLLSTKEKLISHKWSGDSRGTTMGGFEFFAILAFVYCGAHFIFIGFVLILAIVVQGFIVWKKPQCQQVFAGLTLDWRDYTVLAALFLAPPLVVILPGWLWFSTGPSFNEGHLFFFVLAYLLLMLPGVIYARLHHQANIMIRSATSVTAPNRAVMCNSVLNEYKGYLWRLWPASLLMAAIGIAAQILSWTLW